MNPELFRWARETSGLSLEQAADALDIKKVEKLQAIESGEREVSRPILLRMAKQYRRPLVTFYLPAPPRIADRGEDFRTLPQGRAKADDALLDALLRDVKARHGVVSSLVEDDEDSEPLRFVGSMTMNDGAGAVLASIRKTLNLDLGEYRSQRTAEDAFLYLRNQAERAGIFVLLIGNLGTHHTAISVQSFRGFAISDQLAPFVVINDQDAKTAWSFTLMHELAHIWLGTTGVSGTSHDKAIEKFCNDVAARFLLPAEELQELTVGNETPVENAVEQIGNFAKKRHLSRKMVAYALLRSGRIIQAVWQKLDQALELRWQKERADQKAKDRESENGPSYYVVRRHRLGRALLEFVQGAMNAGSLTPVKAAKVLGVKPRSVHSLLMPPAVGARG